MLPKSQEQTVMKTLSK